MWINRQRKALQLIILLSVATFVLLEGDPSKVFFNDLLRIGLFVGFWIAIALVAIWWTDRQIQRDIAKIKANPIAALEDRLAKLEIAEANELISCTNDEIKMLKDAQGVRVLPSLYEDMMRLLGKSAGRFYNGNRFFYGDLLIIKSQVTENSETSAHFLPADAFVFWSALGSQFLYFQTEIGDDPPVILVDGDETVQDYAHFSDWFVYEVLHLEEHVA